MVGQQGGEARQEKNKKRRMYVVSRRECQGSFGDKEKETSTRIFIIYKTNHPTVVIFFHRNGNKQMETRQATPHGTGKCVGWQQRTTTAMQEDWCLHGNQFTLLF